MRDHGLTVDVVSDVVCPWCWIGKRRLEAALGGRGDAIVRWHPYQLNPDLKSEGVDRRQYLASKFGDADRARTFLQRVEAAALESGIAFDFDRIGRQPNTLDAHRLIAWAQRRDPDRVGALVERLFGAFFVDGIDVGDRGQLARIAAAAGFDRERAAEFLDSDDERAAVRAADRRARKLGITGVPWFIFDQRLAVSGAQPAEVLRDVIRQAEQASTAA